MRTSSTNGIPSAALAAYQRAATVINAADKGCHIPWQLIAAIGRVESDHGRTAATPSTTRASLAPGIFGIALDGSNNTQKIRDTDAGQYDADAKFDRAVGPMQFIPSTWSVVGVDADGDAQRNPQDIDDASLATAVYLCSGDDDLGTDAGRRAAVYRYNHSKEYVDLVLRIMQAYMDGDFTSVPNNTTSAVTFTPDYDAPGRRWSPRATARNGGGGTRRRLQQRRRQHPDRWRRHPDAPPPTPAPTGGGAGGPDARPARSRAPPTCPRFPTPSCPRSTTVLTRADAHRAVPRAATASCVDQTQRDLRPPG